MRYNPPEPVVLRVDRRWHGSRFDKFVTAALRWRSRTAIQAGIRDGQITLNGRPVKSSTKVRRGDAVRIEPRPDLLPPFDPDSVTFDVLFEDPYLLVINKPPHLVVHPTCSHLTDNLIHVLNHRYRGIEGPLGPVVPRLAHRIDANTSGVLLLTKQENVRAPVARQFARRQVEKEYHAFVHGVPEKERFTSNAPIGMDPTKGNAIRRAVREEGLPSRTSFHILEVWDDTACISCVPLTGRTHQIRVHLMAAGHPILCDKIYGREEVLTRGDMGLMEAGTDVVLDRHALHSRRLSLTHPVEKTPLTFTAPYTDDLERTLSTLREAGQRS
ncbi:MAG: RluA family pseudouridine synthase [Planctomycetota bacterium]|jgi:23S rRNA pseudouridine1911/1915/1917 synthase